MIEFYDYLKMHEYCYDTHIVPPDRYGGSYHLLISDRPGLDLPKLIRYYESSDTISYLWSDSPVHYGGITLCMAYRKDSPAIISFQNSTKKFRYCEYYTGSSDMSKYKKHRNNGPARYVVQNDDTIKCEWFINGRRRFDIENFIVDNGLASNEKNAVMTLKLAGMI